ncbi:MAG TPA: rhomboid family intramembrane serine protease [Parachlamydiaceae bacterium]|nr:rhomboid family intramembrane serine protease [Parachlamydiaceae bacterium]
MIVGLSGIICGLYGAVLVKENPGGTVFGAYVKIFLAQDRITSALLSRVGIQIDGIGHFTGLLGGATFAFFKS